MHREGQYLEPAGAAAGRQVKGVEPRHLTSTRSAYGGQRERAIIKRPGDSVDARARNHDLLITAPVAEWMTTALPWGRTDT